MFPLLKKNSIKTRITLAKSLRADNRVPKISKILLGLAIGYFFLPIDIIPDFLPVIGHLDDIIVIPLLILLAIFFIPKEVFYENHSKIFNSEKTCAKRP